MPVSSKEKLNIARQKVEGAFAIFCIFVYPHRTESPQSGSEECLPML